VAVCDHGGTGSARAIDRLCQQHAAYRWLCGGAPINHDLLAEFRRENAATWDRLLSQSLTGLIAEKLVRLEELMIDGTNEPAPAKAGVRAHAGRGSMSKRRVGVGGGPDCAGAVWRGAGLGARPGSLEQNQCDAWA
jgi:hypothetical protein